MAGSSLRHVEIIKFLATAPARFEYLNTLFESSVELDYACMFALCDHFSFLIKNNLMIVPPGHVFYQHLEVFAHRNVYNTFMDFVN